MIKMLFIIVFFVVFMMFLAGFSVFRTIRNIFFGGGTNQRNNNQRRNTTRSNTNQQRTQQDYNPSPKKKIFTKDEGEYIEYEEVKNSDER